jgi:hypothetical protein
VSIGESLPASRRREPADHDTRQAGQSGRDLALIDLLDRLLAGGVVLSGHITLAAADIDLVQVDLRALISSVPVAGGR